MSDLSLVIILAAGDSKRMKSKQSKVLHKVAGRSVIENLLSSVEKLQAKNLTVVVGANKDEVVEHLGQVAPKAKTVFQEKRDGTGGATQLALAEHKGDGTVLILAGDTPLLTHQTLSEFVQVHQKEKQSASVLTAILPDPTGYGRVIRGDDNQILKIVEEKDASELEKEVDEINTGVYLFDLSLLKDVIKNLKSNNAQSELYLTDVISLINAAGKKSYAVLSNDYTETLGINDRTQLAEVCAIMRDRINNQHMLNGVAIVDPATTWIDHGVEIESDVVIYPGSAISGKTVIKSGAVIGPRTSLDDCIVEAGAKVIESNCTQSKIGKDAKVGPFTYLRKGTVLASESKAGAFVEIKNSTVGEGTKVAHLSYVGDAEIGKESNIGAATIFVNYDGESKHKSKVGDHVRIGSDTMLVAPVSVGDGAYTAAGSVINEDVPAGAIGIGRARQVNILGWVLKKRKDSKSAAAAKKAGAKE
ncbi:MAG: bifunctional UDP-N-acetylglucosamine diphosphorylase/glucosamine-1-phosphate N-acetyltransferase GlmU [Candidatus Nanopelagicus sp.]|jgi:bifunctional UDP-N-acetylglucosamine pyrophosphorylase/glucosamine-1-phosphate N-acetyltransferase